MNLIGKLYIYDSSLIQLAYYILLLKLKLIELTAQTIATGEFQVTCFT
jgi:hypothetical protein